MSVSKLKTLLHSAVAELESLTRQAAERDSIAGRALDALSYSHAAMAEKIKTSLTQLTRPLVWEQPEPGSWRTTCGDYEASVYKEGGVFYWQVSCREDRPSKTFVEAEEVVTRMLKNL